jgi:hypothetical protein
MTVWRASALTERCLRQRQLRFAPWRTRLHDSTPSARGSPSAQMAIGDMRLECQTRESQSQLMSATANSPRRACRFGSASPAAGMRPPFLSFSAGMRRLGAAQAHCVDGATAPDQFDSDHAQGGSHDGRFCSTHGVQRPRISVSPDSAPPMAARYWRVRLQASASRSDQVAWRCARRIIVQGWRVDYMSSQQDARRQIRTPQQLEAAPRPL